MQKIQILEKMIEWLENQKRIKLPAGLCTAYFRAKELSQITTEAEMLSEITELKAYQPIIYWNDDGFWFNPRYYDLRINICKEIIENLKAQSNG